MSSRSQIYHYFLFLSMSEGDNWHIVSFEKNFYIGFFLDTIK